MAEQSSIRTNFEEQLKVFLQNIKPSHVVRRNSSDFICGPSAKFFLGKVDVREAKEFTFVSSNLNPLPSKKKPDAPPPERPVKQPGPSNAPARPMQSQSGHQTSMKSFFKSKTMPLIEIDSDDDEIFDLLPPSPVDSVSTNDKTNACKIANRGRDIASGNKAIASNSETGNCIRSANDSSKTNDANVTKVDGFKSTSVIEDDDDSLFDDIDDGFQVSKPCTSDTNRQKETPSFIISDSDDDFINCANSSATKRKAPYEDAETTKRPKFLPENSAEHCTENSNTVSRTKIAQPQDKKIQNVSANADSPELMPLACRLTVKAATFNPPLKAEDSKSSEKSSSRVAENRKENSKVSAPEPAKLFDDDDSLDYDELLSREDPAAKASDSAATPALPTHVPEPLPSLKQDTSVDPAVAKIEGMMQENYSKMEFVCQQLLEHGVMTPEVKMALFDFQLLRKKINASGEVMRKATLTPLLQRTLMKSSGNTSGSTPLGSRSVSTAAVPDFSSSPMASQNSLSSSSSQPPNTSKVSTRVVPTLDADPQQVPSQTPTDQEFSAEVLEDIFGEEDCSQGEEDMRGKFTGDVKDDGLDPEYSKDTFHFSWFL